MTMRTFSWAVGATIVLMVGGVSLSWLQAGDDPGQEREQKTTLGQVPEPVRAAISSAAASHPIKEIEVVEGEGKSKYYEAAWLEGGMEVEIKVAATGKLLAKETERHESEGEAEGIDRREEEDEKASESERRVSAREVPVAALAALKKLAAGATITEFAEEKEHGHTFYEGSWKVPSKGARDVLVTPTGDLVEIEQSVDASEVPTAVRAAARKVAGAGTTLGFERKTLILYETRFRHGDRYHELSLTADGRPAP